MLLCCDRHQYQLPYFDGVLEPNTKLQEAAKLLEGKIAGPESITTDRNGKYSFVLLSVLFTFQFLLDQARSQLEFAGGAQPI